MSPAEFSINELAMVFGSAGMLTGSIAATQMNDENSSPLIKKEARRNALAGVIGGMGVSILRILVVNSLAFDSRGSESRLTVVKNLNAAKCLFSFYGVMLGIGVKCLISKRFEN